MSQRVVITGLNIISSLGLDLEENWANLVAGKSGVRRINLFDPSPLQTRIAAQVPPSFEDYAAGFCKRRIAQQMTRVTRMAYTCVQEAVRKSGIDFDLQNRNRCAVIAGAVSTGCSSVEEITPKNRIIKCMSNAIPAWISLHYKIHGPSFTVNTACSASSYAIGLGYDMIKTGSADIVLAGGADSTVNPEEIEGFNELFALSTENDIPEKASRPFDRNRDGFVIGEGAGFLVLESEASAISRGAMIFAEIAGYAVTSEAYNIMSPMKDGDGMALTMGNALENSGVKKGDVDYINAHGTSTTLNDRFETMAIKSIFGERAYEIPVSSSKSMIGHTIAAAGAIESAITVMSIREQLVTPTINYETTDPDLDLDYVPNNYRNHKINVAISNSFAFGGHNATLVFKKYM